MTIFANNPFHPAQNISIYQALYIHIRESILSGELKGGKKLPSSRALADDLNISRNTVLNAYRQLLVEGYLESREGSGTFVANVLPETLLTAPGHTVSKKPWPNQQILSGRFSPNQQRRRWLYPNRQLEESRHVHSWLSRRLWMFSPINFGHDSSYGRQGKCP